MKKEEILNLKIGQEVYIIIEGSSYDNAIELPYLAKVLLVDFPKEKKGYPHEIPEFELKIHNGRHTYETIREGQIFLTKELGKKKLKEEIVEFLEGEEAYYIGLAKNATEMLENIEELCEERTTKS